MNLKSATGGPSVGTREIAAHDFFEALLTTALEPGEILTGISVPKLSGRTGSPFENRIPRRSLKVYVVPPSVGEGSDTARSGTSCTEPLPPTRWYAVRPS